MKKFFVSMLFMSACSVGAFSQNSLSYTFDNKVIDGASISMPQSASLLQVLQVLPELLHRPNTNILENYDLQVEGLSVGSTADAILSQVMLMDIAKIEISNSSTSNYETNGQGGSINVVLKQLKKGTTGNAYALVGYPGDYIPGFSLNNQSGNWTIRSFVTGEIVNQEDIITQYNTVKDGQNLMGGSRETNEDISKMNQMARLYAYYTGKRDVVKILFSENVNKSVNSQLIHRGSVQKYSETDNISRSFNAQLKTIYEHKFECNNSAKIEVLYNYVPNRSKASTLYDNNEFSRTEDKKHSISGKVEYDQFIYWGESGNHKEGSKGYLRLLPGCGYNYSYRHMNADEQVDMYMPTKNNTYNNFFISPYLMLKSSLGKVNIMAKAEFQLYNYRLDVINETTTDDDKKADYDTTNKNFVGAFAATWDINKNHSLRFMANRSLKRPTEEQMFPHTFYSVSNSKYEVGNTELKPMIMNTFELEYLLNCDKGENKWMLSFGGRFIHTHDNINTIARYDEQIQDNITTWSNGDNDNILNSNVMLNWKHRWFAVTATANYFNRHTIGTDTHHRYCNVSVMPQIQTSNDWNICLAARYNTKLKQNSSVLPPITTLNLLVSKTWKKKFTAFVSGVLSLNHKIDEEFTLTGGAVETKTYVPVYNSVYGGIRYNF